MQHVRSKSISPSLNRPSSRISPHPKSIKNKPPGPIRGCTVITCACRKGHVVMRSTGHLNETASKELRAVPL